MNYHLEKIRRKGWVWHARDPELLEGWFSAWQEIMDADTVKSNPVRTVFRVDERYFVKYEHAEGFKLIRNFFSPKAKREFISGLELENAEIPVVKHLGWGMSGADTMLVTETLQDTVSILEYWTEHVLYGNDLAADFMPDFLDFLNLFLLSGFEHPDFHIGNILFNREKKTFALVDVYGVNRPEFLPEHIRKNHYRILFDLRSAMSDALAIDSIVRLGIAETESEAKEFWCDGLKREKHRLDAEWPKRRRQITELYPKFVHAAALRWQECYIRKNPGGRLTVNIDQLPDILNGNNYDQLNLPTEQARDVWLKSFRLEMLGLDHLRPLVFEPPNLLYFERFPDGVRPVSHEQREEFIRRARIYGIAKDPDVIIALPNGRVVARDVREIAIDI